MRLSSTLVLSLLAFNNVSSAFKQTTSIERRMRMLQKKEVGGTASSPPRKLAKGSEKKGGNKSSRSGDKGKDKKGRKKDDDTKKGVNGRYDGKDSKKSHTAHLDANDSGISTDSTEYTYGTPINVSFELTEDLVIGDAGTNGRRLDGVDVNTLKVGLFMRMANPQDGALEPIMQVTPTIVAGDESDTNTADGGRRMLKGTRKKGGDKKKRGDAKKKGGPTTPDPEPPATTINLSGTATFTTTDIVSLDPSIYGVGFDAYLLDENGAAIIGPATFYEEKSQEMIEQAAAEVAIKMAEQAESAIVKYNPTKMKHKGGKKEDVAMMAQAMGIGSGKDGESMIIATTERLANYRLDTDAMYYVDGDDITATFDIHQDVINDGGRMLKKKPWGKKKKKKNKKKNKKPNKPTTTTTTTIATTSATNAPDTTQAPPVTTQAPDTSTTESPPQTTSTVGSTTSESPPQTTDAPQEESTTSQATVVTTSQATSPASTTTVISTDGSTQAAPEAPDTTTTETPPEIDMAADDADETSEDDEMEDEVEIDAEDVRLFSLGIFMRMANPQDGKLSPIHSIPFCPNHEECNKKSNELESGTFKFSSLDLNMEENGSGYDVWVLNGRGEGVAGPHTFYVEKTE